MKTISSFFKLIFVPLVLLFLATACGGVVAQAPEPEPLKISWTYWPGDYPVAIAHELGLFEKHGVKVEPIFYDNISGVVPDLTVGKIDAATLVISDALGMGNEVKVVLIRDNSAGADQVVATSDIKSIADLKGKSVGAELGSFAELMLQEMLRANGLNTSDVTWVDITPEGVPDALPNTIQAGHVWEPHTSTAVAKGNHVIFTSADTPGLIADVLGIRTAFVEERPEDVRAFIEAWFEAVQYWQENPKIANEIIAKHTGLNAADISTEGIKLFSLEDNLRAFNQVDDPSSLRRNAELNLEFLISTGRLTDAPDLDKLLDPAFLPEAQSAD